MFYPSTFLSSFLSQSSFSHPRRRRRGRSVPPVVRCLRRLCQLASQLGQAAILQSFREELFPSNLRCCWGLELEVCAWKKRVCGRSCVRQKQPFLSALKSHHEKAPAGLGITATRFPSAGRSGRRACAVYLEMLVVWLAGLARRSPLEQ